MDILVDGGWELGAPEHEYGAGAARSALLPRTGSWGLYLPRLSGSFTGAWWRQAMPTFPGETLTPRFWAISAASGDALRFDYDAGDNNWITLADFTVAPDWTLCEPGSFLAPGTTTRIRLFNISNVAGCTWFVDDASLDLATEDAVVRSRDLAHTALVTVLQGINGAPSFLTDFGGRWYRGYIAPDGESVPKFPYGCVPLILSRPRWRNESEFLVCTWTLPVMGFVNEPKTAATSPDAIRDVYYAVESILKALKANPTLNGTVQNLQLADGGDERAGDSQLPWGEFVLPLDLSIYFGADVLGP